MTSTSRQTETKQAPDLAVGLSGSEPDATYMTTTDLDFIDLVDEVLDRTQQDLVAILYDNPHSRLCRDYKPFVNKAGVVYCDSCDITVGTLNDESDSECRYCGHPKHIHNPETGKCLICQNECGSRIFEI